MMIDDPRKDLLVQPDQGPSTEAAGVIHPEGSITPEENVNDAQQDRPAYPDADQDTGVDDSGQLPSPKSGDTETPGEVPGEGNAEGLTQGLNQS